VLVSVSRLASMLPRRHWQRHHDRLDPERDYQEIYRDLLSLEFPWDMVQALSFALLRTYAVPSIGRLLDQTGEFQHHTQRRYDDTALLLDEPLQHGLQSDRGRRGIRRINQMHGSYDISNEEMRYVLSTFVVTPKRWLDDYGWRPMSAVEVRASVRYYLELGRLMGIKDLPDTYDGFDGLLTSYEADHFGYDDGGRRVADSTLALFCTFYPRLLAKPMDVFSRALMDDPLLEAFRYQQPPAWVVKAARTGLRARGRAERLLPARQKPKTVAHTRRIRSYPHGFQIEKLGTFPRGVAVRHDDKAS
jgi:hypothetical protein